MTTIKKLPTTGTLVPLRHTRLGQKDLVLRAIQGDVYELRAQVNAATHLHDRIQRLWNRYAAPTTNEIPLHLRQSLENLQHTDIEVRREALRTLGWYSNPPALVMETVYSHVFDSDHQLQDTALAILSDYARADAWHPTEDQVVRILSRVGTRGWTALSCAKNVGPGHPHVTAALLNYLRTVEGPPLLVTRETIRLCLDHLLEWGEEPNTIINAMSQDAFDHAWRLSTELLTPEEWQLEAVQERLWATLFLRAGDPTRRSFHHRQNWEQLQRLILAHCTQTSAAQMEQLTTLGLTLLNNRLTFDLIRAFGAPHPAAHNFLVQLMSRSSDISDLRKYRDTLLMWGVEVERVQRAFAENAFHLTLSGTRQPPLTTDEWQSPALQRALWREYGRQINDDYMSIRDMDRMIGLHSIIVRHSQSLSAEQMELLIVGTKHIGDPEAVLQFGAPHEAAHRYLLEVMLTGVKEDDLATLAQLQRINNVLTEWGVDSVQREKNFQTRALELARGLCSRMARAVFHVPRQDQSDTEITLKELLESHFPLRRDFFAHYADGVPLRNDGLIRALVILLEETADSTNAHAAAILLTYYLTRVILNEEAEQKARTIATRLGLEVLEENTGLFGLGRRRLTFRIPGTDGAIGLVQTTGGDLGITDESSHGLAITDEEDPS